MNTVLIAGGSGFVGTNLVKRFLKLGYEVCVLIEQDASLWRLADMMFSINVRRADFSDFKAIRDIVEDVRPDIVINATSYGRLAHERVSKKIYDVTYLGGTNLLCACIKVGFDAFVSVGSSEEYGIVEGKINENIVPKPVTDYGVAKAMLTTFSLRFAHCQDLPIYCVRPFSIYGDFTPKDRLVGSLFVAANKGVPVILRSPENIRDFLYIDDLVDVLMLICQRKPKGANLFNVGTGVGHTVADVVSKVKNALGIKIDTKWGSDFAEQIKPKERVADSTLAKEVLSWKPQYSLDQGIVATKDWFDRNSALYWSEDNMREILSSVL